MMPEKFLGWYMQGSVPSPLAVRRFNSYCAVVLLLDGCSVLALWAGLSGWTSRPPVPLLVFYCNSLLGYQHTLSQGHRCSSTCGKLGKQRK
eukprot:g2650.t1